MTHTQWRDDFRAVAPNRALAYSRQAGSWIQATPVENIIGAGGMLSTVGDWLLWNENFTHRFPARPDRQGNWTERRRRPRLGSALYPGCRNRLRFARSQIAAVASERVPLNP